MNYLLTFSTFFLYFISFSQVGIGNLMPHPHAQLEVWTEEDEGKGVLLPRILLRDVKQAHPFDEAKDDIPESLLVYNTGSDGKVAAGYYYWSNGQWNKVLVADDDFEVPFKSPWNKAGTTDMAERNDDHIYQEGRVGIGETGMIPEALLDVRGGDALIHGLTVGRGNENVDTNTAVGISALASNTTGANNTATGYEALHKNEGGNNNIATGTQALYNNTTGNSNTATGFEALNKNEGGNNNIATGYQALYSNTTGNSNTATGFEALNKNEGGNNNIATGYQALYSNTTGNSNTATGYQALRSNTRGANNTANGAEALYNNTTGFWNTATGYQALYNNTIGIINTAIGYQALYSNTTGELNTAIGAVALKNNTSGAYNVAVGNTTLYNNTTGGYNIAIGHYPLYSNTIGGYNTAMGYQALFNNTTGTGNLAMGYQALNDNTEGNYNTAIGYEAGPSSGTLFNTTAIGNGASVTVDNTIQLGNRAITDVRTYGKYYSNGNLISSDRRYKENIKTIPLGLDFIKKIRPVEYSRKNNENKTKEWGVIAQELQQTLDQMGYQNYGVVEQDKTPDKYLSVAYTELIAPLIKAVQELSLQNEDLKKKNDQIQVENDKIIKQINEVEKIMQQFIIK